MHDRKGARHVVLGSKQMDATTAFYCSSVSMKICGYTCKALVSTSVILCSSHDGDLPANIIIHIPSRRPLQMLSAGPIVDIVIKP